MNDELIRDIYQRLGGIEAKVDDIRAIRNTANDAHATAERALQVAERAEEAIEGIRTDQSNNRRWLIGLVVSTVFSILGVIFAVLSAVNV